MWPLNHIVLYDRLHVTQTKAANNVLRILSGLYTSSTQQLLLARGLSTFLVSVFSFVCVERLLLGVRVIYSNMWPLMDSLAVAQPTQNTRQINQAPACITTQQ